MNKRIVASALIPAGVAVYFFFDSSASNQVANVAAPAHASVKVRASNPVTWTPDPMAASIPAATSPPFVIARKKKMQALMTGSPPHYYTMKLGELRELALSGDADAMMQLAEQYANEDGRIRSDPDYPVGENPRDLAKKYLSDAFAAGRTRAAALLSKQLFEENQLVDAYAWRLVSERAGDGVNSVWGRDTNQFAALSDSEKTAAGAKAVVLFDTLVQNKMSEFVKSHSAGLQVVP